MRRCDEEVWWSRHGEVAVGVEVGVGVRGRVATWNQTSRASTGREGFSLMAVKHSSALVRSF